MRRSDRTPAEEMMTYDVFLTRKGDKFVARVCQWLAIVEESDTEEDALRKVHTSIQSLLTEGRIVQLEVALKPEEHPWQRFAGMFADDPDWDAFQASIREYREDIDRDSREG
jgi:predicted RNase H-like HicB family nuclease